MTMRSLYKEALARIDDNLADVAVDEPAWIVFRGLCILALAVLSVAQAINHNGRE